MIGFDVMRCRLFGNKSLFTEKEQPMKDKTEKPIKVLLWCCMDEYDAYIERLRWLEAEGSISIVGITGRVIPSWRRLDGYPVIKAERAIHKDYELIIILTFMHEKEEIESCIKYSRAPRDRIIPGRLLYLYGFDLKRYLRLRKEGLSTFANFCWSGFLCKSLAIEHRSPTKNLFFIDPEYLRFLSNLSYYLTECDPVFECWQKGGYEGQPHYPLLRVGDIHLFCNHSDDPDAEIEKWKRRRDRVNFNNMLFEFTSEDPKYVHEFLNLKLPGRKLCMTSVETGHPDAVLVRAAPGTNFLDTVHKGVLGYLPYLSLLDLALGDRPFVRSRF